MACKTTPTNSRRGQSVVEFAAMIPFWAMFVGAILCTVLYFTARQFLDTEVYMLARAQLYGNDLSNCKKNRHWDLLYRTPARVEVHCDRPGQARGAFYVGTKKMFESSVDLLSGTFKRQPTPLRI